MLYVPSAKEEVAKRAPIGLVQLAQVEVSKLRFDRWAL